MIELLLCLTLLMVLCFWLGVSFGFDWGLAAGRRGNDSQKVPDTKG